MNTLLQHTERVKALIKKISTDEFNYIIHASQADISSIRGSQSLAAQAELILQMLITRPTHAYC